MPEEKPKSVTDAAAAIRQGSAAANPSQQTGETPKKDGQQVDNPDAKKGQEQQGQQNDNNNTNKGDEKKAKTEETSETNG